MFWLGLTEFVCMVGLPITLIGFLIQLVRKKRSKKTWGITLIGFCVVTIICFILTPTSDKEPVEEVKEVAETTETSTVEETTPPVEETETETMKTELEKFAEDNGISVQLAESLEGVLAQMKLTDKSRVGYFYYSLSDVYNWRQVEDWAYGERYQFYAAQEHILTVYVQDDVVQSIRTSNGDFLYQAD